MTLTPALEAEIRALALLHGRPEDEVLRRAVTLLFVADALERAGRPLIVQAPAEAGGDRPLALWSAPCPPPRPQAVVHD